MIHSQPKPINTSKLDLNPSTSQATPPVEQTKIQQALNQTAQQLGQDLQQQGNPLQAHHNQLYSILEPLGHQFPAEHFALIEAMMSDKAMTSMFVQSAPNPQQNTKTKKQNQPEQPVYSTVVQFLKADKSSALPKLDELLDALNIHDLGTPEALEIVTKLINNHAPRLIDQTLKLFEKNKAVALLSRSKQLFGSKNAISKSNELKALGDRLNTLVLRTFAANRQLWQQEFQPETLQSLAALSKTIHKNIKNPKAFTEGLDKLCLIGEIRGNPCKEVNDATFQNDRDLTLARIKYQHSAFITKAAPELKQDESFLIEAARAHSRVLDYMEGTPYNNPNIMLAATEKKVALLKKAGPAVANNPQIMLKIIARNSKALDYWPQTELSRDPVFALDLVKIEGLGIRCLAKELRNDPEIALAAVQNNGFALEHLSQALQDNPEIVLAAVQNEGFALASVGKEMRKNKAIVSAAVRQDVATLQYANEALRHDPDILRIVIEKKWLPSDFLTKNPSLRGSKTFMLRYLKQYPQEFATLNPTFLEDPEIIKVAVTTAVSKLNQAPKSTDEQTKAKDTLRDILNKANIKNVTDRELILTILGHSGRMLKNVCPELRADRGILDVAMDQDFYAIQYASPELLADNDYMRIKIREYSLAIQYASPELRADRELGMNAVQRNAHLVQYLSDELRNDPEIGKITIQKYGTMIQYLGDELRNDPELGKAAVQQDGTAIEYLSDKLRNDPELAKTAVTKKGMAIQHISEDLRNDPELAKAAVQQNGLAIQYLSEDLRNDPELAKAAVQQNGLAIQYLSEDLRNNQEIAMMAVSRASKAFNYLSQTLQGDEILRKIWDKTWRNEQYL